MTHTSAANAGTSRELSLEPGTSVDILLTSGSLVLRGTADDRVIVRALDGDALDDDVRVDLEAGVLRIRDAASAWKVGPFSISTRRSRDLAIDVPRTAPVALRTLSGDVVASGVAADSRWATASGDLRVSVEGGQVHLETMSGDATLDAIAPVTIDARTVSGDLRIRAPRVATLHASSTSGDVRFDGELDAGSEHQISSVSGDVELATNSPIRVTADTITGEVSAAGPHRSEGSRGHRTLVVGDGSVTVSVRTTSGDVRLRQADTARDESAPRATAAPAAPAAPAHPVAPVVPVAPVAPVAPAPPLAPGTATGEPPTAATAAAAATPAAGSAESSPRPVDAEEDTHAWNAPGPIVDRREADRLEVLRALERGDLDIESAARRLETLEQAGPRYFRGWC